ALAVLTAIFTGCGSGSRSYDQAAFATCVGSYGATISHLQGGVKPGASGSASFSAHLPYAGMANFLDAPDGTTVGEFIYFYGAPDPNRARSAEEWLRGRNEYAVNRYDTLVVATDPSPSPDLTKLIAACRKQSST